MRGHPFASRLCRRLGHAQPSDAAAGPGGSYDTYVSSFTPSASNVTETSESGDVVSFTYIVHNTSNDTDVPQTATWTVDNGITTGT